MYDQLDVQESLVGSVSIADAKAHLRELVERAAGGDAVPHCDLTDGQCYWL